MMRTGSKVTNVGEIQILCDDAICRHRPLDRSRRDGLHPAYKHCVSMLCGQQYAVRSSPESVHPLRDMMVVRSLGEGELHINNA